MTHPHAPPPASPGDQSFLRWFILTFVVLLVSVVALVRVVDPLGVFRTGLLPPVLYFDRDHKVHLFRDRPIRPEVIVLGSSRSKTIPPSCIERLTGRPAFNFAVFGAGVEDHVAILRFLRANGGGGGMVFFVGAEPESFRGAGGIRPALAGSWELARYAPGGSTPLAPRTLAGELLGWESVSASFRSLDRQVFRPETLVEYRVLEADGLQRHLQAEAAWQAGRFDQRRLLSRSLPRALGQYPEFRALDPVRVEYFRTFLEEAREAGAEIVAFIPPMHPEFVRAARNTPWAARTEDVVELFRRFQDLGLLRYVETRDLAVIEADSAAYMDVWHFLPPVATQLASVLVTGSPGRCAVQ